MSGPISRSNECPVAERPTGHRDRDRTRSVPPGRDHRQVRRKTRASARNIAEHTSRSTTHETRPNSGTNARCSTDAQDLTAQRNALTALGVKPNRIYVDHGLTSTTRARPGLREALAACRSGDTLVVTKLDRLARSLTDARNIVEELTEAGVKLNIGGSLHDPTDPVGRLLFNVLGMIAEFESDLIKMRTREGMRVAKAKGRLRGKQLKLKPAQEAHLVELWRAGKHTSAELAELFSVARSTVYRAVQRAGEPKTATRARQA